MTKEEAIRILDPESSPAALAEIEYYGGFRSREATVGAVINALSLAIDALRAQVEIEKLPAADVVPMKNSGGEPIDAQAALNFLRGYAFKDKEQVYTNGTMLVPLFRVEQALIDRAYNGFMEG